MKVYFEECISEDLSVFSDEELKEKFDIWNREYASKPIILNNFNIGLNNHGHFLMTFQSDTHKYLNITQRAWSNYSPEGPSEFGAYHFEIETLDEIKCPEFNFNVPIHKTKIVVVPENEEERKALRGHFTFMPEKWQWRLLVIPYDDMYMVNYNESDPLKDIDPDMVYGFTLD